ncbi:MAG TPA: CoA ester lyase [Streptosporangiaceae bacterium]|jgi:citrate lyase subunit beta/citryl-CoA lyase
MTVRAPLPFAPRSLLFVPGSRPDMIAKLPRWTADAAVIDLEDAVPVTGKDTAREAGVAAAAELDLPGTAVLVRVNPAGSPWFRDDLRAVAGPVAGGAVDGVVLPKCESSAGLVEVRAAMPGGVIVAGLETAAGVAGCRDLLARDVDAAYFGAEDYIADLGGRRTVAGLEVLHARSEVMLACRLAGISAIDQAVVAIGDDERYLADAAAGRAIGYTGKICVHPRQVELAHRVFTPSAAEVAHAREVLAVAEAGVGTVDGQMVDDVHVRMARQVLDRARD